MATIPVEVGQLRQHPDGHTLRVIEIRDHYWSPNALCKPEPPVKGRRTTSISVYRLAHFDLITTKEPTP